MLRFSSTADHHHHHERYYYYYDYGHYRRHSHSPTTTLAASPSHTPLLLPHYNHQLHRRCRCLLHAYSQPLPFLPPPNHCWYNKPPELSIEPCKNITKTQKLKTPSSSNIVSFSQCCFYRHRTSLRDVCWRQIFLFACSRHHLQRVFHPNFFSIFSYNSFSFVFFHSFFHSFISSFIRLHFPSFFFSFRFLDLWNKIHLFFLYIRNFIFLSYCLFSYLFPISFTLSLICSFVSSFFPSSIHSFFLSFFI